MALTNSIPALRRFAAPWPLLLFVLLLGGSRLSGADFSLFKSRSKPSGQAAGQDATVARLKEIDQASKGFADRFVTYLVDSCDRVEMNCVEEGRAKTVFGAGAADQRVPHANAPGL